MGPLNRDEPVSIERAASEGSTYSAANSYIRSSKRLPLLFGGIGLLLLVIFTVLAYRVTTNQSNQTPDQTTQAEVLLPADAVPSLAIQPTQTLDINGRLRANGSFVLQPGSVPINPVPGEFYLDEDSGLLNYYNGSEFIPLGDDVSSELVSELFDEQGTAQFVSSIGGSTGPISLGPNLSLNGTVLDAIVPDGGVTTIQGLDGDITFTGANGISISGTQISSSLRGGTGIGISNNQISLNLDTGDGLVLNGNRLSLQLEAGAGIGIIGNVISNDGVVGLSGAGSIVVTDNGDGTYTIADGGGAGGGVALAPASAQVDPSTNSSIHINKTGLSGNLLQLQANGNDQFVLGISGDSTQAGDATVLGGTLTVGDADQLGELVLHTGGGFTATIRPSTLTQNTTFTLPATSGASAEICTTDDNCLGSGGGAASDSPFITIVNDPDLQGERALFAPIDSNIAITDFGPNGTVQIDLKTDITVEDSLSVPTINTTLIQGSSLTLDAQVSNLRLQTGGITRFAIDDNGVITLAGLNCSGFVSGGALTTNASNELICSDDDGGGAITGSAATNTIPKFTGANQLGASSITDNGTTVAVTAAMSVQGGINAGGNLVAAGGTVTLGTGAEAGAAQFYNGTNSFTTTLRAGVSTSSIAFTLPTTTGSAGECLITNGSGALSFTACLGGVSSVNGLTDDVTVAGTVSEITVAQQAGNSVVVGLPDDVSITESLGVGTDLGVGSNLTVAGVLAVSGQGDYASVNGILRVSNGTFYGGFSAAGLSANRAYTLPDASGEVCLSSGNCISGGAAPNNAPYLVSSLSDDLTNESLLQAGTNINIILGGGAVTINTDDSPLFDSVRLGTTGTNVTTLATAAAGGPATVSIPNTAGVNDTVCLQSLSNCFGSGGGGGITGSGTTNRIAKFSNSGNIVSSSFTDDGTTVSMTDVVLNILGSGDLYVNDDATINNALTAGTLAVEGSASFNTDTLFVNASTGRVGIGTNNPTGAILDVQGAVSGVTARFSGRVQGADAVGLTEFVTLGQLNTLSNGGFVQDGNTLGENAILGTNDAFSLSLETGGVSRVTIAANGAISSSQNLSESNVMTLTNTSADGGALALSGAASDDTSILNVQSGTLSVTGNGRVGIGTNQPGSSSGQILDVQGDNGSGLTATFSGRVQGAAGVNSSDFVTMSQLSAVNGAFDNVFTRGGNAFGLETALGTNDAQDLILLTNTLEVARFTTDKAFQIKGVATVPAISATGNGRIYFDSTNGYFMCSENGSAYFDCFGTGSDTVNSLNSLTGGLTLGGTVNQVSVADNGTNTITLSLPQDIATTSAPTFGGLNVSGTASATTFSGSGASLINLDAGSISTGTVADARLSSNVAKLDTAANFTSALQQDGNDVCTTAGNCGGADGINNSTTTQTANFNIQSSADTDVTAVLKATATQTADLLQAQDSDGSVLTAIKTDGSLTVGPVTGISNRLTKLTNPTTLPGAIGYGTAWSPDNQYMSIASQQSPYITIYKRSGDTFIKLPNPSALPTSNAAATAWSGDGQYMSVATMSSPYITIYKRSGDTFIKLPNPSALPTGEGRGVAWSSDGQYLTVLHSNSPYVTIYKRDGDTFTKLANPAVLPTGIAWSASFSDDGQYLSVAHYTTPFVTIYKRDGDTFTKLANPSSLPAGSAQSTSFSRDGQYLSVGHYTTPFVTIYKRSGDTFTKLANPSSLPPSNITSISWTSDSQYLSMAHSTTPYTTTYKRSNDTFIKQADLDSLPAPDARSVAWSPDNQYLSVASGSSPYIAIYKSSYALTVRGSSSFEGNLNVQGNGGFTGTVSGADAINANEFVTKAQLDLAISGVSGGASSQGVAGAIQFSDGIGGLQADASYLLYNSTNKELVVPSILAAVSADLTTNAGASTLETTGDVGEYSDIEVTSDGLASIVYIDTTNAQAKYIRCNNEPCTTTTEVTLGAASPLYNPTIRIGSDGLPRIAYTNSGLRTAFVKCLDIACSTTTATAQTATAVQDVSFDLGTTDIPQFLVSSGQTEVYFTCTDDVCSSFTNQRALYNFSGFLQWKQDVVVGSNNVMRFVHVYDAGTDSAGIGICSDATCSSTSVSKGVSSGGVALKKPSILLTSSSIPYLTHVNAAGTIQTTICSNTACSSDTRTTIPVSASSQSSALGTDGNLRIAYHDSATGDLKLLNCTNTTCSTYTSTTIDTAGDTGLNPALALHNDEYRVSYYQGTDDDLKYVYESDYIVSGSTIGNSTNQFAELHVVVANTTHINASGKLTVGVPVTADTVTTAIIATDAANNKGLVVQGATGQTADLFQAQSSDGTSLFNISSTGNVGIGAVTPDTDLEVLGGLCVSDDAADVCTTAAGDIRADGSITANAFDLAELYAASSELSAGTIVAIDTNNQGYVTTANSGDAALGVVSTNPGFVLGWRDNPEFADAPFVSEVALAGRVPVRVAGSVNIGDPITLSETPGVGAKATQAGRIIGYALSSYSGSELGTVEVFIDNGWWMPSFQEQGTTSLQNGGNATFASLNVSGATMLRGSLMVTGNVTFEGTLTVMQDVRVKADLYVEGQIVGNQDTRGSVTVEAGQTEVVYEFSRPYDTIPNVVLTPVNGFAPRYRVEATETGFTIYLEEAVSSSAAEGLEFNYQVQG